MLVVLVKPLVYLVNLVLPLHSQLQSNVSPVHQATMLMIMECWNVWLVLTIPSLKVLALLNVCCVELGALEMQPLKQCVNSVPLVTINLPLVKPSV